MTKPIPENVQRAIDAAVSHSKPKAARRAAVAELVRLANPAAVVPLASLLDGTEGTEWLAPDVRAALEKLGAVSVLLEMLSAPPLEEKTLALELLGNLGDSRAVEPVKALLTSDTKALREQAAVALGRLRDRRAVPALAGRLSDPDADVRMAAAYALGALGGPEAKKALEAALKTETDGFVKIALEKSASGR